MKKIFPILVACLCVFAWACEENDGPEIVEEGFLEVLTLNAENVTESQIKLSGQVLSLSGSEIKKVGFAYWVQGKLSTRKVASAEYDAATKTFSATVQGLNSYTSYSFNAFAEDEITVERGDVLSTKTKVAPGVTKASVETIGIEGLSFNKATLKGKLLTDGNSTQTQVLFYIWERGTINEEKSIKAELQDGMFTGDALALRPGAQYAYTTVGLNELGANPGDTLFFKTNQMVFVDIDATGAGDGSSWANAFTSIKTAISKASSGVELWIAEGIYVEKEIPAKKGYDLYGGFNGTETERGQRDWETNVTTIGRTKEMYDAKEHHENFPILTSQYKHRLEKSIFDGITFQYGDGVSRNAGGVIVCNPGSPSFKNCIFKNNTAKTGGALYLMNSKSYIYNCKFIENTVPQHQGGAMRTYINVDGLILDECVFERNTAPNSEGGALHVTQPLTMRNCILKENEARTAPAIHVNGGGCPLFIGTNIIEGNISKNNPGVQIDGGGSKGCSPDGQ
ncbi:hypothetical protein FUAX_50870 (plasmid) [Fulvitalea axinellae]|uniref:Right handed beta helix domain-containing protein n=1 Tax=Fulvitalea axinellae TaxID=1182444 RepID=A0AAU9DNA4_9BACT|nr:hypothetical protein FUAX_50870 [Fulvitalea axinellae]